MHIPTVSVIISVYNGSDFLEETINSILNQSYDDIELIIVDDGSTDDTLDISNSFKAKDPRVKVFHKTNSGSASTKNYGFGQSLPGKYVAFVDADDVWHKENLAVKIAHLEANLNHAAVYTSGDVIDENSELQGRLDFNRPDIVLNDILEWRDGSIPCPSSALFRRDIYSLIGGWDSQLDMCLDQDIFMRLTADHEIGYIDFTTYNYRIHSNNFSKRIDRMETDHVKAFKKAEMNGYFQSKKQRNRCFANLYYILAASWWVNGNNKMKGLKFGIKSFLLNPLKFIQKGFKILSNNYE